MRAKGSTPADSPALRVILDEFTVSVYTRHSETCDRKNDSTWRAAAAISKRINKRDVARMLREEVMQWRFPLTHFEKQSDCRFLFSAGRESPWTTSPPRR